MSTWRHSWGPPYTAIVRLEEGEGVLHVPRQQCLVCRGERNPITGVIAVWGYGNDCKDNPKASEKDWSEQLDRTGEDLAALEADGQKVDLRHPARSPNG